MQKTYKLTKDFSLVMDGERVPENPLEARLLDSIPSQSK